jgi:hypothetical protein
MEPARRAILLLVAIVLIAVALSEFRKKKLLADTTVVDIESAIDALDPVTRAAVVTRLAADEAKHLRT